MGVMSNSVRFADFTAYDPTGLTASSTQRPQVKPASICRLENQFEPPTNYTVGQADPTERITNRMQSLYTRRTLG